MRWVVHANGVGGVPRAAVRLCVWIARIWVGGCKTKSQEVGRTATSLSLTLRLDIIVSGNRGERIPGIIAAFGGHSRAVSPPPPPATPHAKVLRSSRVCTNSCLVMSPDLSAVQGERGGDHRKLWQHSPAHSAFSRPPVAHPPLSTRGACLFLSKRSMVSSISSGISPASIPSRVALSSLVLTWFGFGYGHVRVWIRGTDSVSAQGLSWLALTWPLLLWSRTEKMASATSTGPKGARGGCRGCRARGSAGLLWSSAVGLARLAVGRGNV